MSLQESIQYLNDQKWHLGEKNGEPYIECPGTQNANIALTNLGVSHTIEFARANCDGNILELHGYKITVSGLENLKRLIGAGVDKFPGVAEIEGMARLEHANVTNELASVIAAQQEGWVSRLRDNNPRIEDPFMPRLI